MKVRLPWQIVPLPTALQVKNDGGGGVSVWVTGRPARASGTSTSSPNTAAATIRRSKRNISTPFFSPGGSACDQERDSAHRSSSLVAVRFQSSRLLRSVQERPRRSLAPPRTGSTSL